MKLYEMIRALVWSARIAMRVMALMYTFATAVFLWSPGQIKWLALPFGVMALTTIHVGWSYGAAYKAALTEDAKDE